MKKTILFFSFLTTLFFTSNAQQLEVAGAIQSDSLSGTNSRVVQTNSTGEMSDVPEGTYGEVLSQGTSGVEWKNVKVASSTPCAPTYPCPTEFSETTPATISWGACLRHCENLGEGGHTDWHMPTLDEALSIFATVPGETVNIWTNTLTFYEVLRSTDTPLGPRRMILNFSTGDMGHDLLNNDRSCKCVR